MKRGELDGAAGMLIGVLLSSAFWFLLWVLYDYLGLNFLG